ncbi:hypothetical protein TCCBUS3UF1_9110 [Thermus sp. CCB_US3_UF1]|nr:hypothetical protein TCCBUS3UF1_9110 [Thermus sp. CCB_US3_UF1]
MLPSTSHSSLSPLPLGVCAPAHLGPTGLLPVRCPLIGALGPLGRYDASEHP